MTRRRYNPEGSPDSMEEDSKPRKKAVTPTKVQSRSKKRKQPERSTVATHRGSSIVAEDDTEEGSTCSRNMKHFCLKLRIDHRTRSTNFDIDYLTKITYSIGIHLDKRRQEAWETTKGASTKDNLS